MGKSPCKFEGISQIFEFFKTVKTNFEYFIPKSSQRLAGCNKLYYPAVNYKNSKNEQIFK